MRRTAVSPWCMPRQKASICVPGLSVWYSSCGVPRGGGGSPSRLKQIQRWLLKLPRNRFDAAPFKASATSLRPSTITSTYPIKIPRPISAAITVARAAGADVLLLRSTIRSVGTPLSSCLAALTPSSTGAQSPHLTSRWRQFRKTGFIFRQIAPKPSLRVISSLLGADLSLTHPRARH